MFYFKLLPGLKKEHYSFFVYFCEKKYVLKILFFLSVQFLQFYILQSYIFKLNLSDKALKCDFLRYRGEENLEKRANNCCEQIMPK